MNKRPAIFLITLAATAALVAANEKYLLTRQPQGGKSQVAEVIETAPNNFLVADETGRIKPRPIYPTDVLDLWGSGVYVKDFAGFQAGLSGAKKRVILTADITVTANLTIPADRVVVFNGYKLKEASTQTILFLGAAEAGRYQIFEGWEAGDIRGSFKTNEVFPEWWGLVGTTSADGQHDIAINCAIRSFFFGTNSVSISLAAGVYWVAKPLDMRGTHCRLSGSGSGVTYINASELWTPVVWEDCNFFEWTKNSGRCDVVSTAQNGDNMTLNTSPGGTNEFIVGKTVQISNASIPAYNGPAQVVSIEAHNAATVAKTFTGNATGVATPVTLDSVMESGPGSHSAIVWLGGTGTTSIQSFHTGVNGLSISCWYAVRKWPLKRISGVSWTGFVEELSPIEDIAITSFSGFGIGGSHPLSIGTTNGLTITNFNLAGSTRRGAVPIYFAGHAGVHALRDGTLDMRVERGSTEWADVPPSYPITWPQFGVLAAGAHSVIDNVHIEGAGNGVHVFAWDGPGSVSVKNCDMIWGMEPQMRWYDDSDRRVAGPAPSLPSQESQDNFGNTQNFYFHSGCLVSIGKLPGFYESANNYNSSVVCENLRTIGGVKYVLRDWVYGVEVTSWENERFPNQDGNALTSYTRGIPYGLSTGTYPNKVAGAYYNKNSPATDKTYFTLVR